MTLITRTAMIQARVVPWVKRESRVVLREMGLSMSEAMELFLRRLIEDRRLPFDVEAFTNEHQYLLEEGSGTAIMTRKGGQVGGRGSRKKNSKDS